MTANNDTRMAKQLKILSVLRPSPVNPFPNWTTHPGLSQLVTATPIILMELLHILRSTTWAEYGNGVYEDQPEFSDMDGGGLVNYLRNNYQAIQGTSKWRLFGLIAKGTPIPENITQAPETYRLGNQVAGVVSVGFSLLEAGSQTDIHRGYDDTIYRFHLPLVIPEDTPGKSKCFFWVDGRRVEWTQPFMFDDTRIHGAWNFTDQDRYVLLVDILR